MMRLILLLVFGCATAPIPEPIAVSDDTSGDDEPRLAESSDARITFVLEHASLADVAHLLGNVTGLRVVLDAGVDAAAECLTISVLDPDPITADEAIAVTRRAFGPAGVALERSATQLVFSRAEGAEFPSCLGRVATQATPPTPPTPTPPTPRSTSQATQSIRAGIRSVAADEVLLTRAALDELLLNQATLFDTVRVIPHEENGQVVALKIYGVRRTSVVGLLGFRNGDGVRRINGYALTSPDTALEAYANLRNATELRVELQRRGQAITQTIRIVETLP